MTPNHLEQKNSNPFKFIEGSSFRRFLDNELQQIYVLELKTCQLINHLLDKTIYLPLKKAMSNYQMASKDHIGFLRKLGLRNSMISIENKKNSEHLIGTFTSGMDLYFGRDSLRDIVLITGFQRIIFYQLAVYRSLYTAAKKIYNFNLAESFGAIINDKKINDSIFSEIALSGVYQEAIDN